MAADPAASTPARSAPVASTPSASTPAGADPVASTHAGSDPDARLAASIPSAVRDISGRLLTAGHASYVVGGCTRDVLLGRPAADWDLTTSARPDDLVALLPGAVYENRFGTVAVRREGDVFEITTFRSEHDYADFRRPHRIEFGDEVGPDLARRDFTVNAIAFGRAPGEADDHVVDPFDGLVDLGARVLRAVGDPDARFQEDALRMVRAVRLAAALEFTIEPATLAAIRTNAGLVAHLSGERVGMELEKLLAAPRPSIGLRLAAETGLLAVLSPDLAAQRGVPQNKVQGEDLWDHTLRAVDAAPANRPVVRLAALLHDIGKPSTLADGHFHHHDAVGAGLADGLLRRLRYPRAAADEVVHLVRHHMFVVDPGFGEPAIRRFIKRIGPGNLDALFALRRADDIGSGVDPDDASLAAFRAKVDAEVAAEAALDRYALAIDGTDLMRELGLSPGPRLGHLIDGLVERVLEDPGLNERATLLLLAQGMLADMDEAPDR